MWRAFTLSVDQLGDQAILKILAKSLFITLIMSGVIGWGLYAAVFPHLDAALRWAGLEPGEGWIADALAFILVALALVLVFRALAIAVLNFFGDEVVAAVERRHYPTALVTARPVSVALSLRQALFSVLRVVGFNLLFLPAYIFLLVVGIGPILFILVNALLFGRDLGEMVAIRHMRGPDLKTWLGQSRFDRGLLGLAVTLLFMVPVVNILVPLLGAAMATHMFHGKGRL